jgi:hypothetical protein
MSNEIDKKGMMPYQAVKERLLNLFEATANKIDREWPAKYRTVDSSRTLFFQLIKTSKNTYDSIVFLISDTPKDPLRKPIYSLSLPPLTRTLFETLVSLLFILEDVPKYITLFMKTGYVERVIDLEHCQKYYSSSPEWQNYINMQTNQIAHEEKELALTPQEIAKPKKEIGRWPTPGHILQRMRKDHPSSSAIPFIEYVNSWLYRELSGLTHLSSHGLIQKGMFFSRDIAEHLFGDRADEVIDNHVQIYRMKQIYISITLMLAIVTEIELHFKYGLDERASYLWAFFSEYSGIVKEVYEMRYKDLLPQ